MTATRRSFLTTAGLVVAGCSRPARPASPQAHHEEEVTPAEDLMREHGVLRRIMYLYDEAALRLDGQSEIPHDALGAGAAMVRRVIEDYHEKLEEDFLFPRFEQAGKLGDLTATLRRQHQTGRELTARILELARPDGDRVQLVTSLRRFNHLYRPHAAREDTVLFPELRELVGARAYAELGEQFEEKEERMLGERGFERAVAEVAELERAFGVDDLASL